MKGSIFDKLKDCVLPGRDPKSDFMSSMTFGVIWAVIADLAFFFDKYFGSLNAVKYLMTGKGYDVNTFLNFELPRIIGDKYYMPEFRILFQGTFSGLIAYAIYRVLRACYDMGYFKRFTNSAFVMKRLGENAPILKRSWSLALAGVGAALIATLILMGIDYLFYRVYTPDEYLL